MSRGAVKDGSAVRAGGRTRVKPPAFQWYPKQWLGDNKVQGMDWDAQAMHFHLINLAWQEEPPGSIPADEPLIRRWLRSPSEDIWRRVRPQIFSAWVRSADGSRWVQKGLVEAAERQERYRRRYDDVKNRAKSDESDVKNIGDYKEDEDVKEVAVDFQLRAPTLEELVYCEYPRKVGKRAALAAIEKAVDRLRKGENGSPLSTRDDAAVFLIQRVKVFANSPKGQNGDYTPHPATWFNQSRYLDDESAWQGGNANGKSDAGSKSQEAINRAFAEMD